MGLFDRWAAELAGRPPVLDEAAEALKQAERALQAGELEDAVAAFGRATDRAPTLIDAWLGLGDALSRLHRRGPAGDAYRRALRLGPDRLQQGRALAGRARLLAEEGLWLTAAREGERAAERLPDDRALAAEVGRALLAAGNSEGKRWLLRAAQGPAASVDLIIEAAEAAPQEAAAEALLRQTLLTHPVGFTAAQLHLALARLLLARGEMGAALAAAESAHRIPEAPHGTTAALLASVLERAGRYPEAWIVALEAREAGEPLPITQHVRLALGAAFGHPAPRPEAPGEAVATLPDDDPLRGQLIEYQKDEPPVALLRSLAELAPTAEARFRLIAGRAPHLSEGASWPEPLNFAAALAARLPALRSLQESITQARDSQNQPLLVAVVGEWNAGKSSVINAFCGSPVAPVGVAPTTGVITRYRYGADAARICFHDGRVLDLAASAVSPFWSDLNDEAAAAIRAVERFVPLDLLRRVELVDTPGLNASRPDHETMTRSHLLQADALVWVFAATQAAKRTEGDVLDGARAAGKRVLGIVNKADQISPADMEILRLHLREILGNRLELILPLSARQALQARQSGDSAQLAASGLAAVWGALDDRLLTDARQLKRQAGEAALTRFVAAARASEPLPPARKPGAQPKALLAWADRWKAALAHQELLLRSRLEAILRHPDLPDHADDERQERLNHELQKIVAATRSELLVAAQGGPHLPVEERLTIFAAFARGCLAGQRIPIPDLADELTRPLVAAADRALLQESNDNEAAERSAAVENMLVECLLRTPLAELEGWLSRNRSVRC